MKREREMVKKDRKRLGKSVWDREREEGREGGRERERKSEKECRGRGQEREQGKEKRSGGGGGGGGGSGGYRRSWIAKSSGRRSSADWLRTGVAAAARVVGGPRSSSPLSLSSPPLVLVSSLASSSLLCFASCPLFSDFFFHFFHSTVCTRVRVHVRVHLTDRDARVAETGRKRRKQKHRKRRGGKNVAVGAMEITDGDRRKSTQTNVGTNEQDRRDDSPQPSLFFGYLSIRHNDNNGQGAGRERLAAAQWQPLHVAGCTDRSPTWSAHFATNAFLLYVTVTSLSFARARKRVKERERVREREKKMKKKQERFANDRKDATKVRRWARGTDVALARVRDGRERRRGP